MVVVAVAGGTGAVGRTIVDAIISQGKHDIIILSRKADSASETKLGVRLVPTDYKDVAALVDILEKNNAHTVISALVMTPDAGGPLESNLIQAADASKATRRMIASDFGFPQHEEDGDIFPSIRMKQASLKVLEATTDLEWTRFHVGCFMDYFGWPNLQSYLNHHAMHIDIPGNAAAIPGDGNRPVAFTHTSDMGKFVAASLDLKEWAHVCVVIGDKVTLNEVVKMAEEAKGTKFRVVYDEIDKLKRGEATELPSQASLYAGAPKEYIHAVSALSGIWFARGDLDLDENIALNNTFPEIKTVKIKELLEQAWKK